MTGNDNEVANSPYTLQACNQLITLECLWLHVCSHKINYSTWQRAMRNALLAKSKLGFVDGSLSRPTISSTNEAAWIKGNSTVISWIFNSLHPSLHSSVVFFYTTGELWKDLEEIFSQGNAPRVHQLKMKIVNKQQQDQTMSVYYTKLKGLWDVYGSYCQLPNCSCGAIKEYAAEREKEMVHKFLMGLNEKFNVVRSQILNTEPLPSLARVYELVSQEERQQQLTTSK